MSRNKSCNFPECTKQPSFNLHSIKSGLYCSKHKLEGMINVKDKRCEYKDCTKIPNYNIKGLKKSRFCFAHKTDDMINVKSKKCNKIISFIELKLNLKLN
jgi:hypothetical protein